MNEEKYHMLSVDHGTAPCIAFRRYIINLGLFFGDVSDFVQRILLMRVIRFRRDDNIDKTNAMEELLRFLTGKAFCQV